MAGGLKHLSGKKRKALHPEGRKSADKRVEA
jgi:hypothetical protein